MSIPVELSLEEIKALILWHCRSVKRITDGVGKSLMKHRAKSLLPSKRESEAIIEYGRELCEGHIKRVEELNRILKDSSSKPTTRKDKNNDSTK